MPAFLFYDGSCGLCRAAAGLALRVRHTLPLKLIDASDPRQLARFPQVSPQQAMRSVHLLLPDGTLLHGYDAIVVLVAHSVRFRWLVPLMRTRLATRIGWMLYHWVTAHRHQISHLLHLG